MLAAQIERIAGAWYQIAPTQAKYEAFVDIFRMKVEDTYAFTGEFIGCYNPDRASHEVAADFITYCKLSALRGVLPQPWDWNQLVTSPDGANNIKFAVEKHDVQDRWKK